MLEKINKTVLVVLSGGQDSATCLAWAAAHYQKVEAISFNYNQRHGKELESAKKIAALFNISHQIFDVPSMMNGKTSGLTNDEVSVNEVDPKTGLPKSFVPARNLIFMTLAASVAISRNIFDLVTGVCQTDYSGYPDCRRVTMDALEEAIYQGNKELIDSNTDQKFKIHTPLMYLTKSETVELAKKLPQGLDAVALSWTCYEGGEKPCGRCPACLLRIKGFDQAGIQDPALV